MDDFLQTQLRAFRQKPASSLSYSESLTFEMLEDLERLRQEGASDEKMQRRISETQTKLEKHAKDTEKNIELHYLMERRKDIQCCLESVQAIVAKVDSMEKPTEGSGDEWETVGPVRG